MLCVTCECGLTDMRGLTSVLLLMTVLGLMMVSGRMFVWCGIGGLNSVVTCVKLVQGPWDMSIVLGVVL